MSLSVWSPIQPLWCTPPLCPSTYPSSSPCWFMCRFMWFWGSVESVWTQNPSSASVRPLTRTWPLRWRWAVCCNMAAVCFQHFYGFGVKLKSIHPFVILELYLTWWFTINVFVFVRLWSVVHSTCAWWFYRKNGISAAAGLHNITT